MTEKRTLITGIKNADKLEPLIDMIFDNPKILDTLPEVLYITKQIPLAKIFTEEKMKLIETVKKKPNITMCELSKKLNRSPQSVCRDIRTLEKYNLLETHKEGRNLKSEVKYNWIVYPIKA